MRKHNALCAQKWGSTRIDPSAPRMAHEITNNKNFQYHANYLLQCLLSPFRAQVKINLNLPAEV